MRTVRLHVNVDHVATLRQARGTTYPSPVEAAALCERAGCHGITVHLREDRRHIVDDDVAELRGTTRTLLNLEMAATDEMVAIASRLRPDLVTLVPEKREERTTEGGLDVRGQGASIERIIGRLGAAGVPVSLFVDPDPAQVLASAQAGARTVELHTGDYADAAGEAAARELDRLAAAARAAREPSAPLEVAAGHGLTLGNTPALVARVPELRELNIGHALVSHAIFVGLEQAVRDYLRAIDEGLGGAA